MDPLTVLALKIQKFRVAPWALKIPFTLLNTYILKAINNTYKNKTNFNKNQLFCFHSGYPD